MACTLDKVGVMRDGDGRLFAASCRYLTETLRARLQMLIKGIRSFSPDNQAVIEFYRPLTLIVGHNGAGKTVRRAGEMGRWAHVVMVQVGNACEGVARGGPEEGHDNAVVELISGTKTHDSGASLQETWISMHPKRRAPPPTQTIIECLKMACTGELPPNTRSGQSFIHDPKAGGRWLAVDARVGGSA